MSLRLEYLKMIFGNGLPAALAARYAFRRACQLYLLCD